MDGRYLRTHYLSSVIWKSTFITDQSLESIQITFAFESNKAFSRKRVASSEPALRPSKELHQDSTFWTDPSHQSLVSGPSHAEQLAPVPAPQETPKRKSTRSVVTCMTPKLTDSGMAEYGVFSAPNVSSSDFNREFDRAIEPAMEVVREIEREEEENERQLVLESQQRRALENQQQDQILQNRARMLQELQTSMAAEDELATETEIQHQRQLDSSRRAVAPADLSREYFSFIGCRRKHLLTDYF